MAKKKKETNNYINNERLLKEFLEWRAAWKELSDMDPAILPPPSEYMVKAFIEIPKRYSRSPKFYSYTYIEDLISAATLAIMRYYWKFDPEISANPFAFLTQVTYFTFIAEIAKERKESYIKYVQTNDFLTRGEGLLDEEDIKMIAENVAAITGKHYNESMVAHHDGTVAKIKKHNKIVEESIENLICPEYNAEELKKDLP